MRSFWYTTLAVVALALGCIIIAYRFPEDDVLRSLALGALGSLITGLVLAGADFSIQGRQRQYLRRIEPIFQDLERGAARFRGTWIQVNVSANSFGDPYRFWMHDRLRKEECHSTLIMVGRSHRSIFLEVTGAQRIKLGSTMSRVLKSGGTVKILVPETADTKDLIEQFFRAEIGKRQRQRLHLLMLPQDMRLAYSALLNDAGVWLMPRLSALAPDKEIMLSVERIHAEYYYDLFLSDIEALEAQCTRVDLTK